MSSVGGVGRKRPVAIYKIREKCLTHSNRQADHPAGPFGYRLPALEQYYPHWYNAHSTLYM
jgi:hypothetical protein